MVIFSHITAISFEHWPLRRRDRHISQAGMHSEVWGYGIKEEESTDQINFGWIAKVKGEAWDVQQRKIWVAILTKK